jgi:hypothetical protein
LNKLKFFVPANAKSASLQVNGKPLKISVIKGSGVVVISIPAGLTLEKGDILQVRMVF